MPREHVFPLWPAALVAVLALGACDSQLPPTAVSGGVGGERLSSPTAVYAVNTGGSDLYKDDVYIILSDVPNLCAQARAGVVPGLHLYFNNGWLVYEREVDPARGANADAGEAVHYKDAEAVWRTTTGAEYVAQSGIIRVDGYDDHAPGTAHGRFDLTFAGGERVTGTYTADYCEDLRTAAQNCTCAVTGVEGVGLAGLLGLWAARRRVRRREVGPA